VLGTLFDRWLWLCGLEDAKSVGNIRDVLTIWCNVEVVLVEEVVEVLDVGDSVCDDLGFSSGAEVLDLVGKECAGAGVGFADAVGVIGAIVSAGVGGLVGSGVGAGVKTT